MITVQDPDSTRRVVKTWIAIIRSETINKDHPRVRRGRSKDNNKHRKRRPK